MSMIAFLIFLLAMFAKLKITEQDHQYDSS